MGAVSINEKTIGRGGNDLWFLVFNATFSNISAISWQPVLVVEEAFGVGGGVDQHEYLLNTSLLYLSGLFGRQETKSNMTKFITIELYFIIYGNRF